MASTAKHTPGPWKWERVATFGTVIEYTLQGPDVLCRYWYDKPQTPDARLIAAAPQLLEALESMVEDLENAGECFVTDQHRIDFMQVAIKAATEFITAAI